MSSSSSSLHGANGTTLFSPAALSGLSLLPPYLGLFIVLLQPPSYEREREGGYWPKAKSFLAPSISFRTTAWIGAGGGGGAARSPPHARAHSAPHFCVAVEGFAFPQCSGGRTRRTQEGTEGGLMLKVFSRRRLFLLSTRWKTQCYFTRSTHCQCHIVFYFTPSRIIGIS